MADNVSGQSKSPWGQSREDVRNVVGAGEAAFIGGKGLVELSGREVTAFGDPALGKLGVKVASKAFVAADWGLTFDHYLGKGVGAPGAFALTGVQKGLSLAGAAAAAPFTGPIGAAAVNFGIDNGFEKLADNTIEKGPINTLAEFR